MPRFSTRPLMFLLAGTALALSLSPSAAFAACNAGTGNITISGSETDCVFQTGDNVTVTVAGGLFSATGPALSVQSGAVFGGITNNGAMQGSLAGAAIDLSAGRMTGGLFNNGHIEANGASSAIIIGLNSDGMDSGIINTGVIEGGSSVIYGSSTNLGGGFSNSATGAIQTVSGDVIYFDGVTSNGDFVNDGAIGTNSGTAIQFIGGSQMSAVYNNGDIFAYGGQPAILIGGSTVEEFTNSTTGEIRGYNSGRTGVKISNGSQIDGSFINDGVIREFWQYGVSIEDSSVGENFTNTGLISAGDIGVYMRNSSVMGTFTNDTGATIAGTDVGSNGLDISFSLVGEDFLNKGTIQGQSQGINLNHASMMAGFINDTGGLIEGLDTGSTGITTFDTTFSGGFINRGSITADSDAVSIDSGTVSGLTNAGSMTSTAGSALAIVGGTTIDADVTNSGTLSGVVGLELRDATFSSADVHNTSTGTITGTDVALFLYDSSGVGTTIINDGLIDGTNYGIFAAGGGGGPLPALMLRNNASGVIRGTMSVYIDSTSPAINIDNYGFMDGDMQGAGLLRLLGTTGRINGGIDVTDLRVEGIFTSEGDIAASSFGILNGARLNTSSNTYTVTGGALENDGVLALTQGTTATVSGDYLQSAGATLRTRVANNTAGVGRLDVTGAATFAAGTGLYVDVNGVNTLAANQTILNVVTSGTLSASTFTVADNSALFKFTPVINATSIDLNVARALSVVDAVDENKNKGGRGAAQVLDTIINNNTAGFGGVVTALGSLATTREVSDAVTETLPVVAGNANVSAVYAAQGVQGVVTGRQTGASGGEGFISNGNAWFKPFGAWAQHDSQGSTPGFSSSAAGAVIGLDGEVADDRRLGFAFSYARGNVAGKDAAANGHLGTDSYQATVYGATDLSPATEATFFAGFGVNDNDSKRFISLTNQTARANFTGYTAMVGGGVSHAVKLSGDTTFTPSARVDYLAARSNGYSESGAGVLNLTVDSQFIDQLVPAVEGKITHRMSPQAKLVATAGVGYDVLSGQGQVVSSYAGGGGSFTTKGLDPSPWLMRGSVGVDVGTVGGTAADVSARYDVEQRGTDFVNQTVSLRATLPF